MDVENDYVASTSSRTNGDALDTSSLYAVDFVLGEEFLKFKEQLMVVQSMIESLNAKIINNSLCKGDLILMKAQFNYLSELEQNMTADKMNSSYVPYKVLALKMVQESYRICDWLIQKECNAMDKVFDVNTFFDKIFDACTGKENPLDHLNNMFKGVLKNVDNFDLHFYGNIKPDTVGEIIVKQGKRAYRKLEKPVLESQVVPIEIENETGENELQKTMTRVKNCLAQAVSRNNGQPVSFFKFAIDPFSLSHSVENLFHLASLAKDRIVKINLSTDVENDTFATITVGKRKHDESNIKQRDDFVSSLFTINAELWTHYIRKYNITERMISLEE